MTRGKKWFKYFLRREEYLARGRGGKKKKKLHDTILGGRERNIVSAMDNYVRTRTSRRTPFSPLRTEEKRALGTAAHPTPYKKRLCLNGIRGSRGEIPQEKERSPDCRNKKGRVLEKKKTR